MGTCGHLCTKCGDVEWCGCEEVPQTTEHANLNWLPQNGDLSIKKAQSINAGLMDKISLDQHPSDTAKLSFDGE
jgi:hypothetical protein